MRTGLGVWENQAKRYQSLQWMRMRRAENVGHGLHVVLVVGGAVGRYVSGAVQPGQQTHRRRQGPGVWMLGLHRKSGLR